MTTKAAGYFENGDIWTGYQHTDHPGNPYWYRAIDKDGNEYDTEEIPTPYPMLTLTRFVGSWTQDQVNGYLNR